MRQTFFLRAQPIPGESIFGYLTRLGKVLNYTSHSWIFDALPTRFRSRSLRHLMFEPDLSFLADALQLPNSRLDAMRFPRSGKNQYNCRGQILSSRDIKAGTAYYCPRCVRESGTHFLVWNLSFVVACPIHNCALVSECVNCSHRFSIHSLQQNSCNRCRSAIKSQSCNPPLLGNTIRRMLGKVGGISGEDSATALPDLLETADLSTALSAVLSLGRAVETEYKNGRTASRGAIGRRLVNGFSEIENWHDSIPRILARQDQKPKAKLSSRLGFFRNQFMRNKDKTIREMATSAVARYQAQAQPRGIPPGVNINDYFKLESASQLLGVTKVSLRKMGARQVAPIERLKIGNFTYIHKNEVDWIRLALSECMSCTEAASILGISDRHQMRAIYNSHLFPHADLEVMLDRRACMFQRGPIERFNERILALEVRIADPDTELPWRNIKARFMSLQRTSIEFHHAVFSEILPPVARLPDLHGLPSLLFKKTALSESLFKGDCESEPKLAPDTLAPK
jgi:hypothetical protein